MSGSAHKHRYKNSALDSVELRRRREEEGLQLRKQKREQQLFKRRNVNVALLPDDADPLQVRLKIDFLYLHPHTKQSAWRCWEIALTRFSSPLC